MHSYLRHPAVVLTLGLVVGLIVGLNVKGLWPSVPLHAVATQGQENFAIATGYVDEQVEAIYFLDFLTGDMKAAVLQPRLGKFTSYFSYNILNDFQVQGQKNPKYLMVTGEADMPRGRSGSQFGKSVVYIAEATTGQIACYAIPWNSGKQAQGVAQTGKFLPLDKKQFRTAVIRE